MAKPRFLRRHYPHQVQGVRSTFCADHLSQAAPPHFLGQNKTETSEVNKVDREFLARCSFHAHAAPFVPSTGGTADPADHDDLAP